MDREIVTFYMLSQLHVQRMDCGISFSHANDLTIMGVTVYAKEHESIMSVESCYLSGCGFDTAA